ncbi:MAG: DUF1659 domain-containing protein [Aminivibrio sp.]|jgi:ABC-type microcin C transport system permease subunit YejE
MAEYQAISSSLSLRRNLGTDDNGKMITATVSISRVSPSVDADSLYGVANSLSGLLMGSNMGFEKKSVDALED